MVFGFEIEGGLHEVPGARFTKELVADGELVEGFLKRLQLGAHVFVVTRLYIVVARIFQRNAGVVT
jgi:hypothetical protein